LPLTIILTIQNFGFYIELESQQSKHNDKEHRLDEECPACKKVNVPPHDYEEFEKSDYGK